MNSIRNSDYSTIRDLLVQTGDLVVATIISRKGSVPRLPGTRMLLTSDGRTFGTIGGGFCESDVIRVAAEIFSGRKSRILQYTSVPGSALPDDIICGGSLEILVEYLPADPYHQKLIADFIRLQDQRQTLVMVVPLPGEGGTGPVRFFFNADGTVTGTPGIPVPEIQGAVHAMKHPGIISIAGTEFLAEPCPPKSRLIICGAGYISQETAPLAGNLGFGITVLDDRRDLLDMEVFSGRERIPVASYETCLQDLCVDAATGILIVTRSHALDLQVLRQALLTPAGYIGMIGSRHKWKALSGVLQSEGFCNKDLDRVHCPVGLEIGADSPEEIAVSIAAELIRYRSEGG